MKRQKKYKSIIENQLIDSINLMYVSLTRAVKENYIISKKYLKRSNFFCNPFKTFIAKNHINNENNKIIVGSDEKPDSKKKTRISLKLEKDKRNDKVMIEDFLFNSKYKSTTTGIFFTQSWLKFIMVFR